MALKKKPPEAEKENGERWLVSYADFMTLLLGLFIILYSKAAADAGASVCNIRGIHYFDYGGNRKGVPGGNPQK